MAIVCRSLFWLQANAAPSPFFPHRAVLDSGLATRAQLKAADPALAAILAGVFGDGTWRFKDVALGTWTDPAGEHYRTGVALYRPYACCTAVQH